MRNSSTRRAGLTDERFEQAKATLERGLDQITTGEDWEKFLRFQATFHQYSFTNTMLIFAQRPDATLVMPRGDRKPPAKPVGWAALGRFIVPGREDSGRIFVWKPWVKTDKDAPEGQEPKSHLRFILVPVYDVSDTDGAQLPDSPAVSLLKGEDAAGLLKLALEFIESKGFTYEFVPSIPGSLANGDMNPVAKHIRICTDGRDERQQAKTAIHEAAHLVLHSSGKGISVPRGQKEVEAESVAFVVSDYFGVDTGDYTFGYVAGWASETGFTPRTVLKQSGKRVQACAKQVIAFMEGTDAPEGEEEE